MLLFDKLSFCKLLQIVTISSFRVNLIIQSKRGSRFREIYHLSTAVFDSNEFNEIQFNVKKHLSLLFPNIKHSSLLGE